MSSAEDERKTADVWWWGQSKEVLSGFPKDVKRNLGYALRQLQKGEEPPDYRPLPSVGKGLAELRDEDDKGWYRVIYLSRTNDVIHVVHAFEKDTKKIPENEKRTAQKNLKEVQAYLREDKRRAKRQT